MKSDSTTRRSFLKHTAAAAALSRFHVPAWAADGTMPTRRFGRTDEKVSLLGLGGYHIAVIKDDEESISMIREAIDLGVTFLDNAWEYHSGRSEELMGRALQDGYREKVFLMTKHHGRDKKTAMQHLEDSLRRLKTDVIDLWQFHEIVYDDDPEMIFSEGGGIEAAIRAKEQGKVRYIGFTGHKDPRHHLEMLSHDYEWDAVQMPLNVLDAQFRSFAHEVLPILQFRGIAPLAMKTMGGGNVLRSKTASPEECLRYAMSLPVATVISGMQNRELLHQNVAIAKQFQPLGENDKEILLAKTREAALTGEFEPFKTTTGYDGPIGRKLHGIG
ncbi:MAG: twin-arginine translocation signal domain-containing protein [bacterium]|nr:twin-arginine translocation signal domain-containing protein [bacterium]